MPGLRSFTAAIAFLVAAVPGVAAQETKPALANRDDVVAALSTAYPAELKGYGFSATVGLRLLVDSLGGVDSVVVDRSAGLVPFDDAAVTVAKTMHFRPATADGVPKTLWISLPIRFELPYTGPADAAFFRKDVLPTNLDDVNAHIHDVCGDHDGHVVIEMVIDTLGVPIRRKILSAEGDQELVGPTITASLLARYEPAQNQEGALVPYGVWFEVQC